MPRNRARGRAPRDVRRFVHDVGHLVPGDDQRGRRPPGTAPQQRCRLLTDARGVRDEVERQYVLPARGREVAALALDRARHRLRVRPALHVVSTAVARSPPPVSVSICSMSALGRGEDLVVAKEVDDAAARRRSAARLLHRARCGDQSSSFSSTETVNGSRSRGVRRRLQRIDRREPRARPHPRAARACATARPTAASTPGRRARGRGKPPLAVDEHPHREAFGLGVEKLRRDAVHDVDASWRRSRPERQRRRRRRQPPEREFASSLMHQKREVGPTRM